MPKLQIIVASTRPGRVGPVVAEWFKECTISYGHFDIDLADLAEINLPFLDEPHHPRLRKYTREHTFEWSRRVEAADAFVFVTPEYNYGYTAPLKNAIDYLYEEWLHKPVGFVSYGGVSGGTRAVQMLKQVVTTLKMMPVFESVTVPWIKKAVDDEGRFATTDSLQHSAKVMLDELARWEAALRPLRATGR